MRLAAALLAFTFSAVVAAADLDDVAAGLKSKDAKVRLKAIEELGAAGKDAAPYARQLCDAAMDPSPKVAAAALMAVGRVEPRLQPPLSDIVIPSAGKSDPKYPLRAAAADAIARLKKDGKPAAGVLLAVLKQEVSKGEKANGSTVRSASLALAKVGADDAETVKTLGIILTSKAAGVTNRVQALAYFTASIKDEPGRFSDAKSHLESAINGPDFDVARFTINGVATLGETAAPLLPALERAKMSSDPTVRAAAFAAVPRITGKKE